MKKIESRKIKAGIVITAILMIAMSSVSALIANDETSGITGSLSAPLEDPYIDYVNVTLIATDNTNGSGVDYTMYNIVDVSPKWLTYNGTFMITGVGSYTVLVYSVDRAGNIEETKTILVNVTTDTIAPVTTWILEGATSYPNP